MAKKIIALIIVCIISLSIFSGCDSGTITSEETTTKSGKYEVYYTDDTKEYLNFINSLDEDKILDISRSKAYWYVTYKIKE